ncbi:MAG: NADAR family protein [Clostridia bacterium]|nr:NADAR family protein [Clostridia bacterium]
MLSKESFDAFFGEDFDQEIYGFFNENRFLSNFHLSPLKFGGVIYPSVEHAYQAAKSRDKNERERIRLAETPAKARKLGQLVELREDWEDVKIPVMEALLRMKFQDPELRQKLIDTYPRDLVEYNWWNDQFWGVCQGQGQNHLGKLLVKIRNEMIN